MGVRHVSEYEPCQVPLRTVKAFGVTWTVHEGAVGDLYEAEKLFKAAQRRHGSTWAPRSGACWCYACRKTRSGGSWSAHAWAVSFDFNAPNNLYTSKQTPCPGDMPEWFWSEVWKPLGYGWGNNWASVCDRMHISKLPREGGTGRLYERSAFPADDPNVDPFMALTDAEQKEILAAARVDVRAIVREEVKRVLNEPPKAFSWTSMFKLVWKGLYKARTDESGNPVKDDAGEYVYDEHLNLIHDDTKATRAKLGA